MVTIEPVLISHLALLTNLPDGSYPNMPIYAFELDKTAEYAVLALLRTPHRIQNAQLKEKT